MLNTAIECNNLTIASCLMTIINMITGVITTNYVLGQAKLCYGKD